MSTNDDRNTHFAGFARLQYEDLYLMFNNLFIAEADMGPSEQAAERTSQNIQTFLAECAYDLAQHTIDALWPYINDKAVEPSATDISDLTQWPAKDELQ